MNEERKRGKAQNMDKIKNRKRRMDVRKWFQKGKQVNILTEKGEKWRGKW